MNTFTVESNNFLKKDIPGFFHTDYLGYGNPGNPDFINAMKNGRDNLPSSVLSKAKKKLEKVLSLDLPLVIKRLEFEQVTICVMPRAKTKEFYSKNQRLFSKVTSKVIDRINKAENGCDFISRHTDTRTTHIRHDPHGGSLPYKGILRDTCEISDKIRGKNIILVDDVYTKTKNVNEDAIQTLLDAGAKSVALYVIAQTKKKY